MVIRGSPLEIAFNLARILIILKWRKSFSCVRQSKRHKKHNIAFVDQINAVHGCVCVPVAIPISAKESCRRRIRIWAPIHRNSSMNNPFPLIIDKHTPAQCTSLRWAIIKVPWQRKLAHVEILPTRRLNLPICQLQLHGTSR